MVFLYVIYKCVEDWLLYHLFPITHSVSLYCIQFFLLFPYYASDKPRITRCVHTLGKGYLCLLHTRKTSALSCCMSSFQTHEWNQKPLLSSSQKGGEEKSGVRTTDFGSHTILRCCSEKNECVHCLTNH